MAYMSLAKHFFFFGGGEGPKENLRKGGHQNCIADL
jgi:hypothetical protein